MQAKKTLVWGLLALAAVPLSAKDDEDRGNCRHWNRMSDAQQIGYLEGFIDGLTTGANDAAFSQFLADVVALSASDTASHDKRPTTPLAPSDATAKQVTTSFVGPSTFGEVQTGTTAICKLPENALLPISRAQEAFAMQLNGKEQSAIDRFLNSWRKIAIENQDSGKPNN